MDEPLYRLAISDTVDVPVDITVNDHAGPHRFKFSLHVQRLDQEQVNAAVRNPEGKPFSEVCTEALLASVTGWRDQRIVLQPDGRPAEFGPGALAALLSVQGLAVHAFQSYLDAAGAKGKEKNSR